MNQGRAALRPIASAAMIAAVGLVTMIAAGSARAAIPPPAPCLADAAARGAGRSVGAASVSAARLATLAKGVNVSNLVGPAQIANVPAAFALIRKAGLRHVRIPIAPDVFAPDPPEWQSEVLVALDGAVCGALTEGLGVVIDLHPDGPLGPPGESVAELTARLAAVWEKLAARYAAASPDLVAFEILNEPKFESATEWGRVQAALARAIRGQAPRNTLIATASPWSTSAVLAWLVPLTDRNVVYAFHFYTPMLFTHQGADWSWPGLASVRGLAFPADASNAQAVEQSAPAPLQPELRAYATEFRSGAALDAEIALAATWGRRWNVPLIVTEFGVYAEAAPPTSRAAWFASVRAALEARGIGWTVWEYEGGFGIDAALRAPCGPTNQIAAALGLCPS